SRGAHARTDFPLKLANANLRRMCLSDVLEIARATPPYALARNDRGRGDVTGKTQIFEQGRPHQRLDDQARKGNEDHLRH
ncbi:hypothetical protein ACC703_39515, partial [Rhizobium ruizarguesonis]